MVIKGSLIKDEIKEAAMKTSGDKLIEAIIESPSEMKKSLQIISSVREDLQEIFDLYFIESIKYKKLELPKKSKQVHKQLLKCGWYLYNLIELPMEEVEGIYNIINSDLRSTEEEFIAKIDSYMNNLINRNSDIIIDDICTMYPKRSKIIKDAYNAHKQELYTLSIPCILTQTDGISKDILGKSIYSKCKHEPISMKQIKKILEDNNIEKNQEDLIYSIQYYPLETITSLSINDDKVLDGEHYFVLNRHAVIHGLDTEYANMTNSNKCIAILGYLYNLKRAIDYNIESSKNK
ncbi:hypothetical protein [Clostridium cochlearium]|uniref:Uncharacterized protein n=1 Tax=Clostridium cochlearium TaxID=1494 RepID=A0A2X2W2D6_CLOCO|nr:hypothetical protein [Clostridium cochlearium]SQB35516.1 Uncharacterised protein [Clostridium cochlearium]